MTLLPWKRRTRVVGLAIAACLLAPPAAFAGFSLTTTAAPTVSVTLNGTSQTPSYTMDLTVDNSDPGSTTAGWNLTITSTLFSTGTRTLASNGSRIISVSSVCAIGPCTDPTNSIAYPLTVPAGSTPPAPAKFFSTPASTGLGTFTVTPTIRVSIRANAYAGVYTSTLTLALVAGP